MTKIKHKSLAELAAEREALPQEARDREAMHEALHAEAEYHAYKYGYKL
jgi:hypothetical protein